MDSKVTLSFDRQVIERAKLYAKRNNMSLSRMIEFILDRMTSNNYKSLDELPISDWVMQVSEGEAIYQRKPAKNKSLKSEYRSRKK